VESDVTSKTQLIAQVFQMLAIRAVADDIESEVWFTIDDETDGTDKCVLILTFTQESGDMHTAPFLHARSRGDVCEAVHVDAVPNHLNLLRSNSLRLHGDTCSIL
jgi:hypothetical protein